MTTSTINTVEQYLAAFELTTPAISGLMGKAIYFPSRPQKWSSATLESMKEHAHSHTSCQRDVATVWRSISKQRDALLSSRYGYVRHESDHATPHSLNEWIADAPDIALRALAIHEAGERLQQSRLFGHHTYHAFQVLRERFTSTPVERPASWVPLSSPLATGDLPDVCDALLQLQQHKTPSTGLRLPGDLRVNYHRKQHVFGLTLPTFLSTALDLPKKVSIDVSDMVALQRALEAYYQLFLYAGIDNQQIGLTAASGSCSIDSRPIIGIALSEYDLTTFSDCVYLVDGALKLTTCMVASCSRSMLDKSTNADRFGLMAAIFDNPNHHASDAAEAAITRHAFKMLRSLTPVMPTLHRPIDLENKAAIEALINALGISDYLRVKEVNGGVTFSVGKPFYAFRSTPAPTSFTVLFETSIPAEALGGALSLKHYMRYGKLGIDTQQVVSL